MKNKGFTLIELLVSIVLLSVAMIFMSSFLIKTRDISNNLDIKMDLLLAQVEVSKMINNDIINNNISSVEQLLDTKCKITFSNNDIKYLEILNSGKTIKYYSDEQVFITKTIESDTFSKIEYIDNTVDTIKVFMTNNNRYRIEAYSY